MKMWTKLDNPKLEIGSIQLIFKVHHNGIKLL